MKSIAIRIANNEYCKPTFIRMREISAKFVKALSQKFLAISIFYDSVIKIYKNNEN